MIVKPESYWPLMMDGEIITDIFNAVASEVLAEPAMAQQAKQVLERSFPILQQEDQSGAMLLPCVVSYARNYSITLSLNLCDRLGGIHHMDAGIEDKVVRQAFMEEAQAGSDGYYSQLRRNENLSPQDLLWNAAIRMNGAIYKSYCANLEKRLQGPSV